MMIIKIFWYEFSESGPDILIAHSQVKGVSSGLMHGRKRKFIEVLLLLMKKKSVATFEHVFGVFDLQIGRGTYSNVYKAREKASGKIFAMKKVRFDTSDSESIKFMAREIMILQKLDHPNVIKLEGIATSRMQYSLYLVFEYMQSDLTRVITRPGEKLTEPQVLAKCFL